MGKESALHSLGDLGVKHVKTVKLREKYLVGLRADDLEDEILPHVRVLIREAYPGCRVTLWRKGKDREIVEVPRD